MVEPLDAVFAFHNAFRNDMQHIDAATLDLARGKQGVEHTIERYRFFNEILVWHAEGEEAAVFPEIEKVAPLVAEAYLKDHRGLDLAFENLDHAYLADDPVSTARAAAAFRFHLAMHLDKEESHLYRIFKERIPPPERGQAVRVMAGKIPQERFADVMGWLFPLIGDRDRENMIQIYQMVLPPEVFTGVKLLIQKAIGSDWNRIEGRIQK